MTSLIPLEPSIPILKKYDLFITKVDEASIIKEYSAYEEKYNMDIPCIAHLKVECEDLLDYANNYKLIDGALIELSEEEKPLPPVELDKNEILEEKINALTVENQEQTEGISTNTDMIFMGLEATTELNEANIQNTEIVLISMDALTEINEQLIALQDQVNAFKGGN